MSTQVQYRRGSATQNNAFTGALGEITVDTTNWTLRVHDGATAGGSGNLATVAYVNAQIGSLSADSISNGTSNVKVTSSGGNVNIAVGGSIVQTVASTGTFVTGIVSATGNITGNYFQGNGSQLTGIDATSIQSGTSSVTVIASGGNIRANVGGSTISTIFSDGINVTGIVSATGNITGNYFQGNGSQLTGIDATSIQSGTSNVRVQSSGGNVSVGVGGSAIIRFTTAGIVNDMGNGVGNIGNATGYFNTVFAKSTSAQYADVAEKYVADQPYPAGTVLEIGGMAEVRASTRYATTGIAGVVSSHPALIMNSGETSSNAVEVALLGRVPCRVTGRIRRGDLLVASATPGVATTLDPVQYQPGSVIGKALADYDNTIEGMIEVLVGRL